MLLDIIKRHLDAFAAGNWNEYKATLAGDCAYEEPATRVSVKGPDEIVRSAEKWRRAFPDLKATLLNSLESGDKIVCELEWEGTQSGPLDGPFGTIQPTRKRGRVKAVQVMTVKNGKISELRHYFDLMTVLGQIGAIPSLGAGQAQAQGPSVSPPRH
jgi:steroid delta-isomerase-like uncharacterized protein